MDNIKKGDFVKVNFNNTQITLVNKAVVINVPSQTGESWIFQDINTGQIHYVSEGCTVSKLLEL